MQFLEEDDDTVFVFPEEYRDLTHHDRLFTLLAAMMAKKDLTPWWKTRSFKVTLPADIASLYMDDEGNAVFLEEMLDELQNLPT